MSEDLRATELVRLMGWPWRLSLITLVTASFAALLAGQTSQITVPVLGALPEAPPRLAFWAALVCAGVSAILALLAGPHALGRLLARAAPAEPAPASAEQLLAPLRQMLQEERGQLREAATAIRAAASVGVQLAAVAQDAEQRLHAVVEQCLAAAKPDGATGAAEERLLAETLRQMIAEVDAGLGTVTNRLSSISKTLEETIQPLPAPQPAEQDTEHPPKGLRPLEHPLAGAAEAALAQIPGTLERLQITGRTLIQSAGAVEAPAFQLAALAERCEAALCGGPRVKGGLPRLEEAVQHLERLSARIIAAQERLDPLSSVTPAPHESPAS